MTSLNPKSGSTNGGTEISLFVDLDPVTASFVHRLLVGF
jgi:hypothetical protein